MTQEMFGTYDSVGTMFESDEYWEAQAPESVLKPGEYQFAIKAFEKKESLKKDGSGQYSIGFQFTLTPVYDEFGTPIDDARVLSQDIKHYFYVGKRQGVDGKIIASPYQNVFTTFLRSIDMTPEKRPDLRVGSQWNITEDAVKGILVRARVYEEKLLSTREHPDTGVLSNSKIARSP